MAYVGTVTRVAALALTVSLAGKLDSQVPGAAKIEVNAAVRHDTSRVQGQTIEQRSQGHRPPAVIVAAIDGLGAGFEGPQGTARFNNPSDNSLAVGPNHIVQTVNSRMAVFTKRGRMFDTTGRVLHGPAVTNAIFKGFGGPCELRSSGDAVVRYDQLARRWLYVLPIFQPGTADSVPVTRLSVPPARHLARRLLHPDQHRR